MNNENYLVTKKIETESFKLIKEIDNLGGAISAIESKFQENKMELPGVEDNI